MTKPSATGLAALEAARREIGRGEIVGENNHGPDVVRFRAGDGTGGDWDTDQPWCGSFASFCLISGGYEGRTSRSAMALADYVERDGGIVVPYPVPGAIIVWRHPKWYLAMFRRRAHVGICEDYEQTVLAYVDGNAGPSPQLVTPRYRKDWQTLLYKIVVPR